MSSVIIKTRYTAVDVGLTVDVALSTSALMTSPTLVGSQAIDADQITTHSVSGLTASTRYYGRLRHPATGNYYGEQFTFVTAPAASGVTWSRKIMVVSCQENNDTHDQAWQDGIDWGADAIWHLGDYGYVGQDIDAADPYTADLVKRVNAHKSNAVMRAAMQSASLDVIMISDHEIHTNGDHWKGDSGLDTLGCLHSIRELQAFQAFQPVRTYWDGRTPRLHRGYHIDYGAKVRVLVTDFRSPERDFSSDPNTPSKQMWGAAQEASLFAALDSTRVNIICNETAWWFGAGAGGASDKPVEYPDAQQRLIDKVNGTGPYAGGPVYKVLWVGGDRHYTGYLSAAANTHGGWPCFISSGMSKNSLPLQTGESPTWQWGANFNTLQTIQIKGSTSSFTLTYSGQTTATITAGDSAASVKTKLEALSNIAPGDVVVLANGTDEDHNPYDYQVRFGGLLNQNSVALTATPAYNATTGNGVEVIKVQAPVVTYGQLTLSYNVGTGLVTAAFLGRAVLDTSGPDSSWVIADIPGGTASVSWTP